MEVVKSLKESNHSNTQLKHFVNAFSIIQHPLNNQKVVLH